MVLRLVSRFLVEACEYLSQHLHTEGIFRKTGSLGRIRALRVRRCKHTAFVAKHGVGFLSKMCQ